MSGILRERLREELADLCHRQWSGWMKYLFAKSTFLGKDGCHIPGWATDRWMNQVHTQYKSLSESEKESDRKEADRFIEILEKEFASDRLFTIRAMMGSMNWNNQIPMDYWVKEAKRLSVVAGEPQPCTIETKQSNG